IVGIEAFTFQVVTLLEPLRSGIQKGPLGAKMPPGPWNASSNVQACPGEDKVRPGSGAYTGRLGDGQQPARQVHAAPAVPVDFIDGNGDLPSNMRAYRTSGFSTSRCIA